MSGGTAARRPPRRLAPAALAALLLIPNGAAAGAFPGPTGVAAMGAFGLQEHDEAVPVLDLEYRFGPRRNGLHWVVGASASQRGSSYLRAGVGRDVALGRRWNAHLSLAPGLYFAEAGKDLGGALEFRSAIDLSYRVRDGLRIGLALAHLSNGGLSRRNPGVETLAITFAWRQPRR